MPSFERGLLTDTDGNVIGWYREVKKDNGETFREERIDKGGGKAEWAIKTFDGTEKSGVIEPGGASDTGVSN